MAKKEDGVTIEFLSADRLEEYDFVEKLDLIFTRVRDDTIIVLDEALSPTEKKFLIERSVKEANEEFPGIEFVGFDSETTWLDDVVSRLTGRSKRDGLVAVGSSDVIEKVREEKDTVSLLARTE